MLVKPIWSVKDDGQIYQSLALFYKRRISSMWIRRSSVSLAFLHVFRQNRRIEAESERVCWERLGLIESVGWALETWGLLLFLLL
jgi:hypothetical protein